MSGNYKWLPNRGHIFVAQEVGELEDDIQAQQIVSAELERRYNDLVFEYRCGAALLLLSNQTLLASLYLSIKGGNLYGIVYICIFYLTNTILVLVFDLGYIHSLSPTLYRCVKFTNSLTSGALTASTYLYLAAARGQIVAQMGALGLSVLLNIVDYDADFRNFLIINLVGLAFSYQTLSQHLRPGGIITLIISFLLSVIICPLISQLEMHPKIIRYYWLLHSLDTGLEIMASSLLLISVSY